MSEPTPRKLTPEELAAIDARAKLGSKGGCAVCGAYDPSSDKDIAAVLAHAAALEAEIQREREAQAKANDARLDAAKALAEALEPLAREADNWMPDAPNQEPIGYAKCYASSETEAASITVGHARAAQRALAAWKAAQQKEPS